jgi:hypothetical protein
MDKKFDFWPKSEQEFIDYMHQCLEGPFDYNTSAEAVVKVTVAAFNYSASQAGLTGFQAGWAQMQFFKTVRSLDLPFGFVDGSKMLYPQYDLMEQVAKWLEEWKPQIAERAKELLEKATGNEHPDVLARWKELAGTAE